MCLKIMRVRMGKLKLRVAWIRIESVRIENGMQTESLMSIFSENLATKRFLRIFYVYTHCAIQLPFHISHAQNQFHMTWWNTHHNFKGTIRSKYAVPDEPTNCSSKRRVRSFSRCGLHPVDDFPEANMGKQQPDAIDWEGSNLRS